MADIQTKMIEVKMTQSSHVCLELHAYITSDILSSLTSNTVCLKLIYVQLLGELNWTAQNGLLLKQDIIPLKSR